MDLLGFFAQFHDEKIAPVPNYDERLPKISYAFL
jgi:hypothetical protein